MSWIVLKVEQLKSRHVLRAEVHLDVGTIEERRPSARGTEEVVGLTHHARLAQTLTEHFEIAWGEHSGVFAHFLIVRVHLELPRFVADDRERTGIDCLIKVHASVGIAVVDVATIVGVGKGEGATSVGVELLVALPTRSAGSEIVHTVFPSLIAQIEVGAKGEKLVGTDSTEHIDKVLHLLNITPKLVAQCHHHERWMVAVGLQNFLALVEQIAHEAFILRIEIAPERQFGLQVDTQFVGSLETSLGWTPRMEAIVVDAIVLGHSEIVLPRSYVHRNMTCEWEHAGIMLTTKESLMSIHIELLSTSVEIYKANLLRFHIGGASQGNR